MIMLLSYRSEGRAYTTMMPAWTNATSTMVESCKATYSSHSTRTAAVCYKRTVERIDTTTP